MPKVLVRPIPENFGLTEKTIEEVKATYVRKVESGRWWLAIWWLVPISGVATAIRFFSENSTDNGTFLESIGGAVFLGFVAAFGAAMVLFIPAMILGSMVSNAKEREAKRDPRVGRLCAYTQAVSHFEYWQKRRQWEFWMGLSGVQFEAESAKVFRSRGYIANLTKASGDEGIDLVLKHQGQVIAVQCKHHAKAVRQPVVREFWGSLMHLGADRGIFIATTGFTRPAWEFAQGKPIELWDLKKLLAFAEGE